VVEVPRARARRGSTRWTRGLLAEGGAIARAGGFEDRPSQREHGGLHRRRVQRRRRRAARSGDRRRQVVRLSRPALLWARENGERTVVSTNTINLQEHSSAGSADSRARARHRRPTCELRAVKGWRNYLCLARLDHARSGQDSLFRDERRAELDTLESGRRARPTAVSPTWPTSRPTTCGCRRRRVRPVHAAQVPHFERCFVFQARRRAAEADVVVVNPTCWRPTSPCGWRRRTAGRGRAAAYRRLILDEAHHVEDVAAQHSHAGVDDRRATLLCASSATAAASCHARRDLHATTICVQGERDLVRSACSMPARGARRRRPIVRVLDRGCRAPTPCCA